MLLLAACGGDGVATTDQATITDSAGITIVQNHRPVWAEGEGWRISAEPILEIGDTLLTGEGRYLMTARRLGSGEIVAFTERGGRWFAADGSYLRPFVVTGEGPGEYRYTPEIVVIAGDTVVAATPQKTTWFGPDGALAREAVTDWERLRSLGRWGECHNHLLPSLAWVLCQHDPTVPRSETNRPSRLIAEGMTSPGPGLLRQLRRQFLVPVALDTVYPLGLDIGIEQQGIDLGGGRETFVTHPFHARSHLAAGGRPMRIASAENPHWEIQDRDSAGRLARIIRRDGGRRAPTTVELAAADSVLRSPTGIRAGDAAIRDRVLAEVITPDSLPGHQGLVVAASGEVMSRRWSLWNAETPSTFDIFDREGRWLGPVTLPPRTWLVEVGHDYVLVIHSDADDVPTLRVYRLER
jgi:hypothetical protein